MTKLLIRLFIKNPEDTANQSVRRNYINFGCLVGICCNIVLFAVKITIGLLSNSVSIMADAFNNLSDIGSSAVTAVGYKMSEKPADKEHPFGHGRMEYMSGLAVAVLIILVGIELFKTSLDKVLHPTTLNIGVFTILALIVSVGIKLWMFLFNRKIGKRIDSSALVATAQDSVNDALATGAVLLSIVFSLLFHYNIDPFMGLLVALFIIYSGIMTIKDTLDPLLGMPPAPETITEIQRIIHEYPNFVGMHDLIIHNYGPGRSFASVHVEVPADIDIVACHENIDACERRFMQQMQMEVVIHMDPIVTDDTVTTEVRNSIEKALKEIDSRLTLHDFRMVHGKEQINLIFDVVIPNDNTIPEDELRSRINSICKTLDCRYNLVLTLDRDYISHM